MKQIPFAPPLEKEEEKEEWQDLELSKIREKLEICLCVLFDEYAIEFLR